MKPGFALCLDHDCVRLLVRVTEGWAELGRADIADPGFEDRLADLRGRAEELAPDGFATRLILPSDQILYTGVDAPGPDETARRAQIAAALQGRTPYAVEDLVFDWSGSGSTVSVAVVARLTLDEAEAFAESHGFRPVAFAAMPEPGQFAGAPFFGPTKTAAAHLPAGAVPARDTDPVRIVDAPLPVPPRGEGPKPDEADTGPAPEAREDAPGAEKPTDPQAPQTAAAPAEAEEGAEPARAGLGITDGLVPDGAADLSETDLVMAEAADSLADDLADDLGPEPGAADAEAPFIAVDDLPEIEDLPDPATAPAPKGAPVDRGVSGPDLPPAGRDEPVPPVAQPARGRPQPDPRHATAAQLRAERPAPEPKRAEGAAAPFAPPVPPAGQRRARLGLAIALVSLLVLFLAAVALWSFWLASAPAPAPGEDGTAIAAAPDPAPSGTAEPVMADPAPAEPQTEAAAEPAPSPESAVVEPAPIDPPDAGTIWADIPSGPATPAADATGAPAISDAAAPDLAATETGPLAPPAETAADAALPLQPLPPPFGTEFDFRPDGLIRATEDGVVTPDGITLFAGRPPLVPAPRPAAIAPAPAPAETPPADADATAPVGDDASAAPPADGAADTTGAAPLPPPVDPAHAALKPRARPAAVVAAAAARAAREAAEAEALARAIASATPQAVATSQRPKARPKGLVRVVATPAVDDAVAAAMASSLAATVPPPAPAPAAAPSPPEEVDEPEPVAATPNIPTSTTVAKQATIANAINLRDINLIGVYGSSSSRRALIRMGNGRYVKVKVGDRLDGGQVAAIGDRELSYVKRGKTIVLKIEGEG